MPLIKFVSLESGIDDYGNPISEIETVIGTVTVIDEDYQHYQDGIDINMTNNWGYPVEVRRLFVEPVPLFKVNVNNEAYIGTETKPFKIISEKAFDTHLELVMVREL